MPVLLTGRRTLVTGASSGLGAVTARELLAAGARVALVARDAARLREVADGFDALVLPADVGDAGQVAAAVEAAAGEWGGLDLVVNAAGVNRAAPFLEVGTDALREMVETNLLGPMHVAHAALPYLLESSAADLVMVSSMSGRRVLGVDSGAYAATKAALTTWSASLAEELGPRGVRVMVLTPGVIDTAFAQGTLDRDQRERRYRYSREVGLSPEDVAGQLLAMVSLPRHVRLHEVAVMPSAQRR